MSRSGEKQDVYTKERIAFALRPKYYGNPRFKGFPSSLFRFRFASKPPYAGSSTSANRADSVASSAETGVKPQLPQLQLPPFYPIIDTGLLARTGIEPAAVARALADGGAGIAQFRHKGPYSRVVFEQAEEVAAVLRTAGIPLVVNDRADIALMLVAAGVHVGQDDLEVSKVRSLIGGSAAIGLSTHNEEQLRAGNETSADYLAIGPIFETASKENPDPLVGLRRLERLRSLSAKPLVAIGGIQRTNAQQVLAAGADSVAVISDLIGEDLKYRIRDWVELTRPSG